MGSVGYSGRHPAHHHLGRTHRSGVAGYIAKYAKAAECVGTLDRRVRATDDPAELPVSPHARRGSSPGAWRKRASSWKQTPSPAWAIR
jgi:hypothetical protein